MKLTGLHTDQLIGWSVSAGLHVLVAGAALHWGAGNIVGLYQNTVPPGQARALEAQFAGSEPAAESVTLAPSLPLTTAPPPEHTPHAVKLTRAEPIDHPLMPIVEVSEFELTAEHLTEVAPDLDRQPTRFWEKGENHSNQPRARLARHTAAFQPGDDLRDQKPAIAGAKTLPQPFPYNREPVYPEDALRQRLEGRVVLLVAVSAAGRVTRLSVAQSSGNASFDAAALAAVEHWRFSPALLDGQPVENELRVPVRFRIEH